MAVAWVLCSANFSEGRRPEVVAALVAALSARVLSVAAHPGDHRCVIQYATPAAEVVPAALRAARAAVRLIDLNSHRGAHPRMGALDVLALAPVTDMTLDACRELAAAAGAAVAADLQLPVFLYGEGARRSLAAIRGAGFEELRGAIGAPERAPDFGPAAVHPTAGAVAVGVRLPPLTAHLLLAPGARPEAAAVNLAAIPAVRDVRPQPGPEPALAVTLAGWTAAPLGAAATAAGAVGVRLAGLWPLAPLLGAGVPILSPPDAVLERAILEA